LPERDASESPAPGEEGEQDEADNDEQPPFTTTTTSTHPRKRISSSPEIGDDEFDSDPEVSNCLLSEAEVEIKERIWVHENKDYLRAQQAKAIKLALIQADPSRGPTRPRKRRRTRLGDIGYLNGDGPDAKGSRASTPAEATRMMLEQRGFSKKINYKLLEEMYAET
jgi:transcription factor IIIB subunit 2